MTDSTPYQYGRQSEARVIRHLRRNGYKILEQNYRTPMGEIDIIARDAESLVFIEVKSKRSSKYGHPKWAVTPQKQRRISMTALHYLKQTKQSDCKARFDVVTVTTPASGVQIDIYRNAFDLAYP